jgi:hypothetical protein
VKNKCYQRVTLEGPTELVTRLYRNAIQKWRFCDTVAPIPLSEVHNEIKWRRENWGTPFDVSGVKSICSSWPDGVKGYEEKERSSFTFECWTAESPPEPVWDALLKMGFTVSADYYDECGNFEGSYRDGVTDEWLPGYGHFEGTCGQCDETGEKGTTCRSCGRGVFV